MADKRYFAKMDVGYYSNPKWFRVARLMRTAMPSALPPAVRSAVRLAQAAHSASIYYCREHQTDGRFPVDAIKAVVGVQTDEEEAAITALFDSGMWINHALGDAEIRDYLEHQEAAERSRARSEAARAGARARWEGDADRNADRNATGSANRNAEERRGEERRFTPTAAPATGTRGTRIPTPFTVTPEMVAWARENVAGLDHRAITAEFEDYWRGVAGAKGVKLDWAATWRNWLRRKANELGPAKGSPAKNVPTYMQQGHPDYDPNLAALAGRS